jgi:hypothetical protein
MATIPIYDQTVLPCVTFPMVNTRAKTTRYLGQRAITGDIYAELNMVGEDNQQVKALDDFWKNECNYGLEPFLIRLPVFGRSTDVDILVTFSNDIKDTRNVTRWDLKRKIKVLGLVVYTIDGNGDFILSDEGHYVLDDDGNYIALKSKAKIYKEITYGITA